MPRTRVVIQSRLDSSRLPGKAMLTLAGMPLVELVARRAARTGFEVVVATSDEDLDGRIADHLDSAGIAVVRGSLDDVLGRFVAATTDLGADDLVVRLTGDNPFTDAALVQELLDAVAASGHAYGRIDIDHCPEGMGAEVFPARALREADVAATRPYDREHVTPWLRRELGELLFVPPATPAPAQRYRCTIDTLVDYDRVSRVFASTHDPVGVPWTDLMAALDRLVSASPWVGSRSGAAGGPTSLTLSTAGVGANARQGRETVRAAVACGVQHVLLDGSPEAAARYRRASEPAAVRRLEVAATLPLGPAPTAARVERLFADLGRRFVDVLLLDAAEAQETVLWEALRGYVADGCARLLGVRASGAAELEAALRLPDLAWLVVDEATASAADLPDLGQGKVTCVEVAKAASVARGLAHRAVTTVAVAARDAGELTRAAAGAAG